VQGIQSQYLPAIRDHVEQCGSLRKQTISPPGKEKQWNEVPGLFFLPLTHTGYCHKLPYGPPNQTTQLDPEIGERKSRGGWA
jgi:hypothetical protein